jgi:hypothetical protein
MYLALIFLTTNTFQIKKTKYSTLKQEKRVKRLFLKGCKNKLGTGKKWKRRHKTTIGKKKSVPEGKKSKMRGKLKKKKTRSIGS